jgi:LmbE family N-acetylglucosaminyl deacetylase
MEPEHSVLLLAAHPDDETLSAGIRLARCNSSNITIVHVTDGSPRDRAFATRAGFSSREAYAQARREELAGALRMIGIGGEQCRELGYVDQEAYLNMPEIVERLIALIDELRPDVVLTHPYEGGHPDHDTCAFAAALARQVRPAKYLEFTSYHAGPGGLVTGEFLGRPESETLVLTEQERTLKRAMADCFRSQADVVARFPIGVEKFRPAPEYDFSRPPHHDRLLYEEFGWGITGEGWRALASEAATTYATYSS